MTKLDKWGKDHWSLLAYIETRCVDYKGILERSHMRCNENKHPLLKGLACGGLKWDEDYSTITKDGRIKEHDDWDVLDDLEVVGFIEIMSLVNQRVQITDKGRAVVNLLREHKSRPDCNFSNFDSKTLSGVLVGDE